LDNTLRTLLIITGVSSPQIFGPRKRSSDKKSKDMQDELGIEFVD